MVHKVLLYWPNIIGYFRIGLVFAAWAAYEIPAVFVLFYSISIALDGVDGWLARRLGQTSRFGAWLDVVVDNLGRGMLWSQLYEWGWLVSTLEWCVFVCNHSARGDHWKNSFTTSPAIIQAIMANGFRTPLGTWVVSGLHCLPLWLYGYQRGLLSSWLYLPLWIQVLGTVLLAAGRLLALSVEVFCIWTYIDFLTNDELEEKKN
ncbi:CDP-diacylglycerol--glycerol-3-phosphate 3-phosphatidyltransferase isoform X1 [Thunnus maccoyii]|uniref:CDP-diacylglycerol--glycerol-3-phosphate 3-phosphatidyltransferase isoform X1 n=1 Tax=Thunnus maccoyii TaxID=8240 RepID=UPI001C4C89EE|nr:CDP-diacylglycerol--glycerol-3-phosphate 3-phosphatidyltransferase isoform X1 [Thunnus maccoyii]